MSVLAPILWAFKLAPVKDREERLILMAVADAADQDGCNSYQSKATIAERAMCDTKTVTRRLRELEGRKLIARGDQRATAHLPADKRPVVYDVLIPYTAFGDGIDDLNAYRKGKGRGPITPENRPAIGPAPKRATRSDKRQDEDTAPESGGTDSPPGAGGLVDPPVERGDYKGPRGGTDSPERGDYKTPNPPKDLPNEPSPFSSPDSLRSSADDDEDRGKRDLNAGRGDVDELCQHLADRLTAREVRHTVTKSWRDAARLMLDSDGRTLAQVHNMIEWCQDNEFWRSNIHSMPKLREKYDQMREQAMRTTGGNVHPIRTRHQSGNTAERQRMVDAFGG